MRSVILSLTITLAAVAIGQIDSLERRQVPRRNFSPRREQNKCRDGEVACGNVTCTISAQCRHCIPSEWECDGQSDCPIPNNNNNNRGRGRIGSDEQNCRSINCKPNHFQCGGDESKCVPPYRVCDGRTDCRDGSDEAQCDSRSRLCPPGLLPCDKGRCIPANWRCDGKNQCSDGADEQDCDSSQCGPGLFRCGSGQCVNTNWRCDGVSDCSDSSDEKGCRRQSQRPTTTRNRCPLGQVTCDSGNQCIHPSWRCNGVEDCSDGSDERICGATKGICAHGWFTCSKSGVCLERSRVCDRINDCPGSNEDEQNCTSVTTSSDRRSPYSSVQRNESIECGEGQFNCDGSGSERRCISLHLRCDGQNQCDTDELNCGSDYQCPHPLITCKSGPKRCAPSGTRCDGVGDCDDGSDETNCPEQSHNGTISSPTNELAMEASESQNCPADKFRCNSGKCISSLWMCDGDNDCGDNSDEVEDMCETRSCTEPTAGASGSGGNAVRFGCDKGRCVPADWLCDGEMDCVDGSDEIGCGVTVLQTRSTGSGTDGNQTDCFPQQFNCEGGGCVDQLWMCNGVDDCGDGSDEEPAMCARRGCSPQQFQCNSGGFCLPLAWLCDGGLDCEDGSDEEYCQFHGPSAATNNDKDPTRTSLLRSAQKTHCSGNQFECSNQIQCVSSFWVCDGNNDCSDGSDEQNCNSNQCQTGEYRCELGHCIPDSWVCDGSVDCHSESDEKNCASSSGSSVLVRSASSSSGEVAVGMKAGNKTAATPGAYTGLSPDVVADLRRRLRKAFVSSHLGEKSVALRHILDVLVRLPRPAEPHFLANDQD